MHFLNQEKNSEIPQKTTSSQGMEYPDCRVALLKTGTANGTGMFYCKDKKCEHYPSTAYNINM
jgi:hypothetical protein